MTHVFRKMSIVVLEKSTHLDLHGEKIQRLVSYGALPLEHLDVLKKAHQEHYQTKELFFEKLKQANISYIELDHESQWPDLKDFDGVVSVGGDGTLLSAAQHILDSNKFICGIRSAASSVGYLCCGGIESLTPMVKAMKDSINHKDNEHLVFRMEAHIFQQKTATWIKTKPFLNDLLYAHRFPAATTRYDVNFQGKKETHKSSGIWFATSAGSTGGISTTGVKAVPMDQESYQFAVREPYQRSRTLHILKGFFDPDQNPIFIENRTHDAILALDGSHGVYDLDYGDYFYLKKAAPLRMVCLPSLK